MKTYPLFLLVLLGCSLAACNPPEEEVHPKRPSARNENLKRYVSKAQELRAQVEQRAKPIVNGPLLGEDVFTEFVAQAPKTDVSAYLLAQQKELQETVRSGAAQMAAEQIAQRLDEVKKETVAAVGEADSPQELANRLNQFAQRYQQELNEQAQQAQQETWALPTAKQSHQARANLRKEGEVLLEKIKMDYGETCAQKARPILAKAGDDYWLALSSVKQPEQLQQTLEKIGQEADENLTKVVQQYGDPMVKLSSENAATLRARLIEAHQNVEQQFEKLYGKKAVLKTREKFEPYLAKMDELLAAPGRLSEKKTHLEELGAQYRQQVTTLQVQLNDELEKKVSALAQTSNSPIETK